ncbi:hypothetical protein AAVH_19151, partial [Aphelenchoides avenae]
NQSTATITAKLDPRLAKKGGTAVKPEPLSPDSWEARKVMFEQTIQPKEARCQELVGKIEEKTTAVQKGFAEARRALEHAQENGDAHRQRSQSISYQLKDLLKDLNKALGDSIAVDTPKAAFDTKPLVDKCHIVDMDVGDFIATSAATHSKVRLSILEILPVEQRLQSTIQKIGDDWLDQDYEVEKLARTVKRLQSELPERCCNSEEVQQFVTDHLARMGDLCTTTRKTLEDLREAATRIRDRLYRLRTWWDFVIEEDSHFESHARSLMEHAKELCAKLQLLQERPGSSKENLEGRGVSKIDVQERELEIQLKKLSAQLDSEKEARATAEKNLNWHIDLNKKAKEALETMRDQLKAKTEHLTKTVKELATKEQEMTMVKEQLSTTQEELRITTRDLQTADEALETAGAQLRTTKEKLTETGGELAKAKEAASSLHKELEKRSKERDDAVNAKDEAEKKEQEAKKELKATTDKYDERRRKASERKKELQKKDKEISALKADLAAKEKDLALKDAALKVAELNRTEVTKRRSSIEELFGETRRSSTGESHGEKRRSSTEESHGEKRRSSTEESPGEKRQRLESSEEAPSSSGANVKSEKEKRFIVTPHHLPMLERVFGMCIQGRQLARKNAKRDTITPIINKLIGEYGAFNIPSADLLERAKAKLVANGEKVKNARQLKNQAQEILDLSGS